MAPGGGNRRRGGGHRAFAILCLARPGRTRCLGLGVLLFPFMFVLSRPPGSGRTAAMTASCHPFWPSFWLSVVTKGRFGCVAASGPRRGPDRRSEGFRRTRSDRPRTTPSPGVATLVMSVVVALSVTLTVATSSRSSRSRPVSSLPPGETRMGRRWPPSPSWRPRGSLTGYADYWVAYKLRFPEPGPSRHHHGRRRRRPLPLDRQAGEGRAPGPPSCSSRARQAGVDGTAVQCTEAGHRSRRRSESTFLATLQMLGVGHGIISTGVLQAVVPFERLPRQSPTSPASSERPLELTSAAQPSSRPATNPSRMSASDTRHSVESEPVHDCGEDRGLLRRSHPRVRRPCPPGRAGPA